MIQAITDAASRFRKKYTLTMLMFIFGTALAFTQNWSAEDYRWFCALLLAIFGTADLADNGVLPFGKKPGDQ